MSIQMMLLGVGAVDTKTYVDDVFSTFLYTGNQTARNINIGINMASDGGLTWVKGRDNLEQHYLHDSTMNAGIALNSNNTSTGYDDTSRFNTFTSTGFSVGNDDGCNKNTKTYSSWSWRKAPGFFDVVTWSGNATAGREISHNLGSVPGMIIVKEITGTQAWHVYHKETGPSKYLQLNSNGQAVASSVFTNGVMPTSTVFTLSSDAAVNGTSKDYVAYVFAGGESGAATARSVEFDGSDDYLTIADHADFDVGTNWTGEAWFKADSLNGNWDAIFGQWTGGYVLEYVGTDLRFYLSDGSHKSLGAVPIGQWHHVAISKSGSTTKIFLNGIQVVPDFDMGTTSSSSAFTIGGNVGGAGYFNGKISNVRIVQGTAVYTSAFKPPTEPLTNITNTKLLCCNNSSTTGSSVTPGTITAGSSPTARTDSPFDDPAGFKFGDAEEGIVKCGSYVGNGSTTGPEINLGWEPSWVMVKRATGGTGGWIIWDSMRGMTTGSSSIDKALFADATDTEASYDYLDMTSTGFKLKVDYAFLNNSGDTFVYLAVRRPDGYVGKPPELGTGVFNIDLAGINAGDPSWVSGFPVDMQFIKDKASTTYDWFLSTRLTQGKYLSTESTAAEAGNSVYSHDYQNGWGNYSSSDAELITSWMFKRHAGFDVVTYKGNGSSRYINHSMSQAPQMMWFKKRNDSKNWYVYHSGLNGGSNPQNYSLRLNTNAEEDSDGDTLWNQTAPTATHFRINTDSGVNADGDDYLALLFSSVSGISKVGYYTGTESQITITTGFQPRFVLIKRTDSSTNGDWYIYDTLRGLSGSFGTGNTNRLSLNSDAIQAECGTCLANFATGFYVGTSARHNTNNGKYIYYCHA